MELRDIEIFLTLAEELHFGRTADRLLVSRARVSQAIKVQERRIGAPLFERTSRNVALTPIGAQLRDDLADGYRRINEGLERAAAAAKGLTGVLSLGIMDAMLHEIHAVTDLFRERHPECRLQIREAQISDPFGPLRAGTVDVQLVWLPVEEPDLTVGPVVVTEPMVLAVSARHHLAQRETVSLEDLVEGPVLQSAESIPAYWEEAINPRVTPSGKPIPRGPAVATVHETLANIAAGLGMAPVPAHAPKYFQRADIAFVPIHDMALLRWGLVWRNSGASPLVRAFAQAARDAVKA
ncbi:LysR family transcriptional regulator [Yinghuangia soli]|uniref:LysR family transcriptional regulator n=1 Tax=Yinghuangia soli TaxID=2908204 RepID=A0AA41PXR7_9ACTN|nr:LysR family transcriptional regulator [Yinghuangia soli]MCF2527830.1 LysR family transcriptional regulator [Yinghuangia soli]